jgi:hypothetical protein
MTIKYAEQKIGEATRRVAAIDRTLAALLRQSCSPTLSGILRKELRDQAAIMRTRRDRAYVELLELIELAGMPPEYMGWA